jgi:hypothetical protein
MKIMGAFPSKYLSAADLQDKPHTLIMQRVEMETIGGDDKKPVLYFSKSQKGLVLNKTNSKQIAAQYGDDTDEWEGKPIVLFPAMVDYKGDTVEAIRVRAPKAARPGGGTPIRQQEPQQVVQQERMQDEFGDDSEIPF